MEGNDRQAHNSDQQVVVETNNFIQVLDCFDEDGNLLDQNTRFKIQCGICTTKNIALVNHRFDRRSRETHESYTVLPRCGHAFGYTCLYEWIKTDMNLAMPTCPMCRADVFDSAASPEIFELYGDANSEEQNQEIIDIRYSFLSSIAGPDQPPLQQPAPEEDISTILLPGLTARPIGLLEDIQLRELWRRFEEVRDQHRRQIDAILLRTYDEESDDSMDVFRWEE
ncbi:hypothetical protein AAE478_009330 [Parahypoxylon ruwenzoriense]